MNGRDDGGEGGDIVKPLLVLRMEGGEWVVVVVVELIMVMANSDSGGDNVDGGW